MSLKKANQIKSIFHYTLTIILYYQPV